MAEITQNFNPLLSLDELYETPTDILEDLFPLVTWLKTKDVVNIVRIIYSWLTYVDSPRKGLDTPVGIDSLEVNDLGNAYLITLNIMWLDCYTFPETWYYDGGKKPGYF